MASVRIVMEAWPLASRLALPNNDAPSKKLTVPVGMRLELTALTVAVKVTRLPTTDGLGEEESVVVVNHRTVWTSEALVGVKVESPLYWATIVWLPTANDEIVKVACPLVSGTVANKAVPSKN